LILKEETIVVHFKKVINSQVEDNIVDEMDMSLGEIEKIFEIFSATIRTVIT